MIQNDLPQPANRLPASRMGRRAVAASFLFHLALLVVLVRWYLPSDEAQLVALSPSMQSGASVSIDPPSLENDISKPASLSPDTRDHSSGVSATPIVPADQIEASLTSKIDSVQKAPNEVKLKELDRNLQRLEQIANDGSVEELTSTIASSMGIDAKQYADKPVPADGLFDHDTAQIKSVSRTQNDAGQWQYEALMVDEKGRELAVPLTAAEGQPAYEMFERMKQNPFAEGLYRQLVMPMLQKMLQSK